MKCHRRLTTTTTMMMTMLITDDSTQTRLGVAGVGKNRASDGRDGSCQENLIATMSYHGNRNKRQTTFLWWISKSVQRIARSVNSNKMMPIQPTERTANSQIVGACLRRSKGWMELVGALCENPGFYPNSTNNHQIPTASCSLC